MTELKTLLDFLWIERGGDEYTPALAINNLILAIRQEAIKHLKKLQIGVDTSLTQMWIINFFNLTEEDLK